MAQTGYTPISIYYSSTASNTPTAGNLVAGELAINTADGKLFYKDSAGVVQVIGTKGGVGSSTTTQVLYNSSGLVVGSANLTFNGTTLTTANDASISGLTVGRGGSTVTGNNSLGTSALAANTTGSLNTAVGWQAVLNNTTGGNITATGFQALAANTTGSGNTALGMQALYSNTTASNNTAVGYQAGYSNTTGTAQVLIGSSAGYSITTGNSNVCIGAGSGYSLTTGTGNTFVGGGYTGSYAAAGNSMTTGSGNSIFGNFNGNQGGLDIRTSNGYIVLSDGFGNPRGIFNSNGDLFTGLTARPSGANTGSSGAIAALGPIMSNQGYNTHAGAGGAFTGNLFNIQWTGSPILWIDSTNIGTITVVSDYRIKRNIETQTAPALERVMALRPVTYQMADYGTLFKSSENIKEGFIAHEVQEVIPSGAEGEKDVENQIQSLRVDAILAVAVKAIQEQQAIIETLTKRLTTLENK